MDVVRSCTIRRARCHSTEVIPAAVVSAVRACVASRPAAPTWTSRAASFTRSSRDRTERAIQAAVRGPHEHRRVPVVAGGARDGGVRG